MKRDANTHRLTLDLIKKIQLEADHISSEIIKKKKDFHATTMNGFGPNKI
jgi:hypothetical protein